MKYNKYRLDELAIIKYGKNQKKVVSNTGKFKIYGTGGLMGYATDFLYDKPSVLIGRKGTIEKVRYVTEPFWTVDTLFYTIIDENKIYPHYFYYLISLLDLKKYNEGTTIPSLRTETLNRLEFYVPDLNSQKRILSALEPIDDKIELNTRINENLEQQAQAIFKSWFVDFEPFGRVMPADWRMGTLSEIAEVSSGKRPLNKSIEKTSEQKVVLVGASSIMGYTSNSNYNCKILVIGRVGTHGIVQRFNYPCWASDNTLVIKSNYYEFTYQILKRIDYKKLNRGSTQPLITQADINKEQVTLPTIEILEKFEIIVSDLMNVYEHNLIENQRLSALRDTLLPKLMNGETDISNL